ncbi:hypothetical protein Angca_001012, partial [Angiostrongylus cantonensis]
QDEMERELRSVEERWMERTRDTMQERDILVQKLQQLEEQVESLRTDLNRLAFKPVSARLDLVASRLKL